MLNRYIIFPLNHLSSRTMWRLSTGSAESETLCQLEVSSYMDFCCAFNGGRTWVDTTKDDGFPTV